MELSTRRVAALFILLAFAGPTLAQNYPTRPIRLLVPSAPGGGLDVIARIVATPLTESLGRPS